MIGLPNKKTFFLFVLFFSAFILRAYNSGSYPFGFDQVQIANEARNITHGDFTFIGPRTGPAHMFTGPLIYYVAAFFTFFVPSYYAVVVSAICLSMLTGIALFTLAKKYISQEFAYVITTIWAFSPFLIHFDRIPWNPNISILASALVFFPLLKAKEGLNSKDMLLVSIGVLLGYQAHFSGLLLYPLAIGILLLLSQKKKFSYIVLPTIAFGLSLLPTLIFDYKNNWLNAKGLYELVTNKEQTGTYQVLPRIGEKILITIQTLGRILFNSNTESLILITGVVSLGYFIYTYRDATKRTHRIVTSIWMGAVIVGYALYRQSTPEYYYLLLIPAFVYILASILIYGLTQNQRTAVLGIFALYSAFLTYATTSRDTKFSLQTQLWAKDAVADISTRVPVKSIVYDMENTDTIGMKYLFEHDPIQYQDNGVIVHVQYPSSENALFTRMVSTTAGVWVDSRTDPSKTYVTKKDYIIAIPNDWVVYEDIQQKAYPESEAAYVLFDGLRGRVGSLYVFDKKHASDFSPHVQSVFASKPQKISEKKPSEWAVADNDLVSCYKQKMFMLEARDAVIKEKIEILVK